MPRKIYYCASGCGVSSEDPKALHRCSKCRVARYCCRDHQVSHWKKAHKLECFDAELQQRSQIVAQFCDESDPVKEQQANQLGCAALNRRGGIAVFLGTNQRGSGHKIVTDVWREEELDTFEATPSDLYLPHVPPTLIGNAEDVWVANPTLSVANAALTEQQCTRFMNDDGTLRENRQNVEALLSSVVFRLAVKTIFETSGEKQKQCLDIVKEHVQHFDWNDWQKYNPAALREEAETIVGKTLSLEGGIDMVYLTPPVPCFATLTKSQLHWFNGSNEYGSTADYPILYSPVVAYRCIAENWCKMRFRPVVHCDIQLDTSEKSRGTTAFEGDAIFLKMFVAAAELGDVTAIYACRRPARAFAVAQRLEIVFIQAAHKLLQRLCEIHPEPAREEAYFLYEIGEVHESRASWLMSDDQDAAEQELLLAARCYHSAAGKTHQFSPNQFIRFPRYHALGVTLTHLNDSELAKRAYLWAMTDPSAWMVCGTKGSRRLSIIRNLSSWWDSQQLTEATRKKSQKKSLKHQRAQLKDAPDGCFYSGKCQRCGKSIQQSRDSEMRCSRCLVSYCSSECQKLHWPEHKNKCRTAEVDFDLSMLSNLGTCTDSTREILAALHSTELKATMSLTDAYKKVDEWKQTRPSKFDVQVPSWLIDLNNLKAP